MIFFFFFSLGCVTEIFVFFCLSLVFFCFFFRAFFFSLSLSLSHFSLFYRNKSRNRQSSRTKRPEHTERSQPWRDVSTFSLYFSSRSRSSDHIARGFARRSRDVACPPGLFFSFFFSLFFCVLRGEACSAFSTGGGRCRAKRNVQNAVVAWRVSRTFFARVCDGMSRRNVSLVFVARFLARRWVWCAPVDARSSRAALWGGRG